MWGFFIGKQWFIVYSRQIRRYEIFLLFTIAFFSLHASSQTINIPDVHFKAALVSANSSNYVATSISSGASYTAIDANGNGQIEVSEASQITSLNIHSDYITNVQGLEYFINLKYIDFDFCSIAGAVDLSMMPNLEFIDVSYNTISSLNVAGLSHVHHLNCGANQINTLNISAMAATLLELTYAINNVNVDLSGLVNLTQLNCTDTNASSLDLSDLTSLTWLSCGVNNLTELDLSHNPNLAILGVNENLFTAIDVSTMKNLTSIFFWGNPQLQTINLKNGKTFINSMNFVDCPQLEYICADEVNLAMIQNKINSYGYTICNLNSYCSFVPGGDYFTLHGNNRIDVDNNGCSPTDLPLPNLKFSVSNGTTTSTYISSGGGTYDLPLQAGSYTITPILENPDYFTLSPTVASVNFPSGGNFVTEDFCLAPFANQRDLEITLLPLSAPRPGFGTSYKLIVKNKGNSIESAAVTFTYDNSILDFVSSYPPFSIESTNNMVWSFPNMMMMETREIYINFDLHAPTETPPAVPGNQLNFVATVSPIDTDVSPGDNVSPLKQLIVGSMDPNDKTCLEGTTVSPAIIGKYVHYIIRFENTGTANAENIVVKDIIDTAKFDISSLIPLSGSHSFITRILNTNKVEFIFENINLPFADANNDGYVAFKIKTKPTLIVGNTFSNSANIYFDYNFPIATNTATTTITALGTSDFEFSKYFALWPNPVKNNLNITTKNNIAISSISIYSMLGQLIQVATNASALDSVDVSDLKSGNYFLKINSDKGISTSKFIKE